MFKSVITALISAAVATSVGAKVSWLGNHPENYMEFRDVWSKEGGTYTLTIHYLAGDNRTMEISVNGGEPIHLSLPATDTICTESIDITLATGQNTMRIANPTAWPPDIDCIHLHKATP